MRVAASLILAFALAACGGSGEEQAAVANADSNLPGDVEALPPDESVATSNDELATGENDPDGGELGNQH